MAVTIAGTYMDRSLNDFQRACEQCIENEQEKLMPDVHLIDLLCDAIRLTREMAEKDRAVNQLVGKLLDAHIELRKLRAQASPA